MSNGKHSSDEGFELNIPFKEIGSIVKKIVIIAVVIIILLGAFLWGKAIYKKIKEKPDEESVVVEDDKMPTQISGYKVLGKLEIESKEFSQYILDTENNKNDTNTDSEDENNQSAESTDLNEIENENSVENNTLDQTSDALKLGLVKLYGDELNAVGNFCIIGHNENEFFSVLNELNVNDDFKIKDSSDIEKKYIITEIYTVDPTDLKCLMPNNEYKEITLITCSSGSNQRLIVKAIEENDYNLMNSDKEDETSTEQDNETNTVQ